MHFGDKVFRTIIPRNIRLAEAPSFGKPVLFHDRESRGALAYLALAGEMIRREEEERDAAAAAASASDAAAIATNETAGNNGTGAPDVTPHSTPSYGATTHDAVARDDTTASDATHSAIGAGDAASNESTTEGDTQDEHNPASAHSGT
jgi:hypothetical protein